MKTVFFGFFQHNDLFSERAKLKLEDDSIWLFMFCGRFMIRSEA